MAITAATTHILDLFISPDRNDRKYRIYRSAMPLILELQNDTEANRSFGPSRVAHGLARRRALG